MLPLPVSSLPPPLTSFPRPPALIIRRPRPPVPPAALRREEEVLTEMLNDARRDNERTLRECVRLRCAVRLPACRAVAACGLPGLAGGLAHCFFAFRACREMEGRQRAQLARLEAESRAAAEEAEALEAMVIAAREKRAEQWRCGAAAPTIPAAALPAAAPPGGARRLLLLLLVVERHGCLLVPQSTRWYGGTRKPRADAIGMHEARALMSKSFLSSSLLVADAGNRRSLRLASQRCHAAQERAFRASTASSSSMMGRRAAGGAAGAQTPPPAAAMLEEATGDAASDDWRATWFSTQCNARFKQYVCSCVSV